MIHPMMTTLVLNELKMTTELRITKPKQGKTRHI